MTLRPVDSANKSGAMSNTSGSVQVMGQQNHNLLVINGLPEPPDDHSYRLWAHIDGRHVGCVRFVPDGSGRVKLPNSFQFNQPCKHREHQHRALGPRPSEPSRP